MCHHHTTLSLAGHWTHPLKVYLSQNEWEKIAAFTSLSSLFIIFLYLFLLAAMHFVFFSSHFSFQCCMVCFGSTFLGNVKASLILYIYIYIYVNLFWQSEDPIYIFIYKICPSALVGDQNYAASSSWFSWMNACFTVCIQLKRMFLYPLFYFILFIFLSNNNICFVFENGYWQVSVPYSSLLTIVTVRCGHCANLLSVNMGASLQAFPPQEPQVCVYIYIFHILLVNSHFVTLWANHKWYNIISLYFKNAVLSMKNCVILY